MCLLGSFVALWGSFLSCLIGLCVCGGGAEIATATSIITRTLEQQLEKHAVPPSTAEAAAEDRLRTCT
jgi:hypothetical protein